ncbi:AIR synthase-related protein [Clostridium sp. AM33-3]|uniref:AIR synthase-related protein n=1 Tax=Clostridium sp. AM33-3 TaxID=2292304 RepID=UPI001FA9C0A8|nr:AIR synthase-related protein [Clostridium sp. AM33-3]
MMRKIERENTGLLQAGQDLVVAGYAGLAGTIKLAEAAKEELSRWFSDEYMEEIADAAPLCPVSPEFWHSCGAAEWEPAGEGGILTAIWNLTGAYETGVEFYLRQIPMRQETVEVCERLELNPYRLYSLGCVLLTADNGGQLVRILAENHIPAQVIGRVNKGIAREMIVQEGRGFLERPQPDEITKVIPDFFK